MNEHMYGESWSRYHEAMKKRGMRPEQIVERRAQEEAKRLADIVAKEASESSHAEYLIFVRLARCLYIQTHRDLNQPHHGSYGSLTPDEQKGLLKKAVFSFYQEARDIGDEERANKLIHADPTP